MATRDLLTCSLLYLFGQAFIFILQTAAILAGCKEPFGMQNGLITDSAISASSEFSSSRGAKYGRLGLPKSWTAGINNNQQWFRVDFGRIVNITQLATQGRVGDDEWVEEYRLFYSNDGRRFSRYRNPQSFQGNSDENNRRVHSLNPWIRARFIRINPRTWKNKISLRAEFYGCREGCLRGLGMEDKRIADSALSASSFWSDTYSAQAARLNLVERAWSPKSKDSNPWLQVDFSRKVSIVQVGTQGEDGSGDYWVKSYTLSYIAEGQNVVKYKDDHVFEGNWDQNTIVINVLQQPIIAFKVRIHPRNYKNFIALRAEFYGCRKVTQGNVTAIALSAETIIVQWQIARNSQDNSLPCGFTVGHRETTNEHSDFANKTVGTSATQLVINGLLAYTMYEIKVEAINGVCSGTFSNSIKVITHEKAPAAPPFNVTVVSVTFSSVTISWQPPERRKRNGRLLAYSIKAWELSVSSNVSVTRAPLVFGNSAHNNSSANQKGVIRGLKESTHYQLEITVSNSAGFSPPSLAIRFLTPKAPSSLTPSQRGTPVTDDKVQTTKVHIPTSVPTEAAKKERREQETITVSDGTVVGLSAAAAVFFICILIAAYIFHRRKKNEGNTFSKEAYESPLYGRGEIPIETRCQPNTEDDKTYSAPVDDYKRWQKEQTTSNAEHSYSNSEKIMMQTQVNIEQANRPGEDVYAYANPDVVVSGANQGESQQYALHNPIYETSEDIETNSREQNNDCTLEHVQGNPIYSSLSESIYTPAPLIKTTIKKPVPAKRNKTVNTKGVFQNGFSSSRKANGDIPSLPTEPDYAVLEELKHGSHSNITPHHGSLDMLQDRKSQVGKTTRFQEKEQSEYEVIWDHSASTPCDTAIADTAEIYDKLGTAKTGYEPGINNSGDGSPDNIYDTASYSIA